VAINCDNQHIKQFAFQKTRIRRGVIPSNSHLVANLGQSHQSPRENQTFSTHHHYTNSIASAAPIEIIVHQKKCHAVHSYNPQWIVSMCIVILIVTLILFVQAIHMSKDTKTKRCHHI
jgi:hypothetical protein